MSADLTCPTCRGSMTKFNQRMGPLGAFVHRAPCPDCTDGRRLPELREWDALKDDRDRRIDPDDMEAVARAAEKWGPPPEGIQWRTLLAELADAKADAQAWWDALQDERNGWETWAQELEAERDRYREALESIRVRCREGDRRTDWLPRIDSIARAALDFEGGEKP